MGIKDTVLGWLRTTPDKQDELEDAEADELTREYSADRADTVAGFELGGGRGDFERDQEAPRRWSFTVPTPRRRVTCAAS